MTMEAHIKLGLDIAIPIGEFRGQGRESYIVQRTLVFTLF